MSAVRTREGWNQSNGTLNLSTLNTGDIGNDRRARDPTARMVLVPSIRRRLRRLLTCLEQHGRLQCRLLDECACVAGIQDGGRRRVGRVDLMTR